MRITKFLKSNQLLHRLLKKVIDYSNQLLLADYSKALAIGVSLLSLFQEANAKQDRI